MGQITFQITGGTPNYQVELIPDIGVSWTYGSAGIKTIYDIPAGDYAIRITDSNGCVVTVGGIVIETTTTTEIFCEPIFVCGAGTTNSNGEYVCDGDTNGHPLYINGNYVIFWIRWSDIVGGESVIMEGWVIREGDCDPSCTYLYYSSENVITPNLVSTWQVGLIGGVFAINFEGQLPLPNIQLGECSTTTTTETTTTTTSSP